LPSTEEIIERLARVHLFSGLNRKQLRALSGLTHEGEYRPGEVVCRQGQPGQRYFVVEQGTLRVTRVDTEGRVLEVRDLNAGEAFGETSLLLGDVHDATVEATERTLVLYLEKADFDGLLDAEPSIDRALRMREDVAERRAYPRFSWLEEGELPIKVLHKHPAALVPSLFIPGLIGLILVLSSLLAARLWGPLALAAGLVLAFIPFAVSLYGYIDWYNDLYIVTNRRVAHQERVGLVREHFSAAPLHAIQDIQQVQEGPVARFWQYGDIIIETAGGAGQVVFRNIPRPGDVRTAIFDERARTQALVRVQERDAIRQAVDRYFRDEAAAPQRPAEEPQAQLPARGCMAIPVAMLRSFVPRSWHREGDTVTWRKHWVALARAAGAPLALALTLTGIAVLVAVQAQHFRAQTVVLYALAAFFLIPWLMWKFDDWQNDFYRVTSTRVIHVERLPLFLREERREASLEQVTNVRFDQSFWGKILKYGDVTVETAAPAGTFHFRMVHRPRAVQAEIFAHIEAARGRQQEQELERRRAEMLDWFSIYDEMRQSRPLPSPPDEETE
jgi:uncharacterized membrane protein YdbT with pleckstrin-like domain